jgi:hypothetical protein
MHNISFDIKKFSTFNFQFSTNSYLCVLNEVGINKNHYINYGEISRYRIDWFGRDG